MKYIKTLINMTTLLLTYGVYLVALRLFVFLISYPDPEANKLARLSTIIIFIAFSYGVYKFLKYLHQFSQKQEPFYKLLIIFSIPLFLFLFLII